MPNFWNTERSSWAINNNVVGFKRTYKNLRFYNVLAAGHMIPIDQPEAAQTLLVDIIGQ
jgi:carboxypeptidase C (cathepsin A)